MEVTLKWPVSPLTTRAGFIFCMLIGCYLGLLVECSGDALKVVKQKQMIVIKDRDAAGLKNEPK